jgi:hypothetical protein
MCDSGHVKINNNVSYYYENDNIINIWIKNIIFKKQGKYYIGYENNNKYSKIYIYDIYKEIFYETEKFTKENSMIKYKSQNGNYISYLPDNYSFFSNNNIEYSVSIKDDSFECNYYEACDDIEIIIKGNINISDNDFAQQFIDTILKLHEIYREK